MFSPEPMGESPGADCSFDISSPEVEPEKSRNQIYEDSQEETDDLFNFDYTGSKPKVQFVDRATQQAMFLRNLKEVWRMIDQIETEESFQIKTIKVHCDECKEPLHSFRA